jgi:hypothetical protein
MRRDRSLHIGTGLDVDGRNHTASRRGINLSKGFWMSAMGLFESRPCAGVGYSWRCNAESLIDQPAQASPGRSGDESPDAKKAF